MSVKGCGWALALLLVAGCDKLGIPGLMPADPPPPPAAPPVAVGPWLLDPTAGQVTVAWTTREPSVGRVWYGTRDPDRLATEPGGAVTGHRVVLPSLQPSTQYRYRVEGAPETSWFTSAPQAGADGPIHVLVYGDNRTNNGDHSLVARAAAAEHPQLLLHTGDMVAGGEDPLWRLWFHEEHDLLAHAPIVTAAGDLEGAEAGARFFQRKGSPAYRSFDYGPVHAVVLDSLETSGGAPSSGGLSDAQKAWLLEDLRGVPPERHVWVLVHHGPWSHPLRPRPGHGGNEDVRQAVLAANRVHPIEAVFAGHDHFYERGEIDGVRFFVLGGGGAPLEDPYPATDLVKAASPTLSYATVEVCGCHSSGRVKDISGKVIDAFQLAQCATPCSVPGWAAQVAAASIVPAAAVDPEEEAALLRKRRKKERRKRHSVAGSAAMRENVAR